jgi:hypothetical protein
MRTVNGFLYELELEAGGLSKEIHPSNKAGIGIDSRGDL